MKETQILFKHHIGRMIRFHWYLKGKVKVIPTTAENVLKSHGHSVIDVKQFLMPPRKREKIEIIGAYVKELPKDENHPDYQSNPCYIFRDDNVLIEGLEQAKVLTNTVEISKGLPETLIESEKELNLPDEAHLEIKRKIKLCCMFDAMQEALPRRKDPLRPAWIFTREFGITDARKNNLLCKNLVAVCEQFAQNKCNKASILDAFFSVPLKAYKKNIQFEITSDLLITTQKKLKTMAEPSSTHDFVLPDLGPMDCTASLNPYNFYTMENIYPPGSNSKWPYVQTAFVHFSPTKVKNITEEEVTESQIQGRSLLMGFSIAAAEAHAVFGNKSELPEPIVVPVIQTDGRMFHFTIFQLNTLNLGKDSQVKNIFWNSPMIPLYSVCEYKAGRPILEGYNPDVIRKLVSFYNIK